MSLVLDTRSVRSSERRDFWATGIAQHFFPVSVDAREESGFDARMSGGDVGSMKLRLMRGPAHRVARTRQLIGRSDPEQLLFYWVRSGSCRIEQDGRQAELAPGDIGAHDTSRPSWFESATGFDVVVLAFPRGTLGRTADLVTKRTALRVAGQSNPLVRVAAPLLSTVVSSVSEGALSGSAGESAERMILPLIHHLYAPDESDGQGRRVLVARRMRDFARANLADPGLGPERIAAAHFVSTRFVHKLFEDEGGVSSWIRAERLSSAARDLRETTDTVAEVAARWGYRDAASFARAFRNAHGCSPSEARANARGARLWGGRLVESVDQASG